MKFKPLMLLFSLASLIFVASCTEKPQADKSSIAGVTLSVASPFGKNDGRNADYLSLIKEFEELSGAFVADNSPAHSSESWKNDIVDSFADGTEPDVIFFFIGGTAEPFISAGKVVDLDTIRSEYPGYAVNINHGVLNSMKAADEKNYCVPVTGFWEGLFINSDLFKSNNVPIPKNFEEFKTAVERFNSAGVTPVAVNLINTPHYWFEYLVYNYTGPDFHMYPVTENGNYERWVNGLNLFKTLYDMGAFPKDPENVNDDRCLEMFKNKEAAMMLDGSWSKAVSFDESVEIVHFPVLDAGVNRKTSDIIGGFSMGYYITEKAWNTKRDAAVEFVKHMTDEHALSVFNKNGSASPGPVIKNESESETLNSINEAIGSATAFSPAIQDTFSKEAREYLFEQIIHIARGEASAAQVLDKFIEMNN